MRSGLAQEQERPVMRSSQESATFAPSLKEIPYDYVARFTLEGKFGKRQQDVISISIEGAFIATAIGYGFLPRTPPLPGGISGSFTLEQVAAGALTFPASLGELLAQAAANELAKRLAGISINTDEARVYLARVMGCLFRLVCGIDFKYSIVDSGTGRELQNQPIHNIAGLGKADGDRPFRPFPKPMMFLPRSTIRIEVEEISEGSLYAGAELQIVLHGYKMIGAGT